MKKNLRFTLLALLLLLLGYLLFWPVEMKPQAWNPPPAPALDSGQFAANEALKAVQVIPTSHWGTAPEDVAIGPDGSVYVGLENGSLIRFEPGAKAPALFARTGGRPLGLKFHPSGDLIICDAERGLLAVDTARQLRVLADQVAGAPIHTANDLDISPEGVIYFTDAMVGYPLSRYKDALLEHQATGRLLRHDPRTGETTVLAEGLVFANGVALDPAGRFVWVAETGRYRIHRYWLRGPQAGEMKVWFDNLPGFPDGISSNGRDLLWIALANPRNAALDATLPYPFVRKIIDRLPDSWQPQEVRYGMVLALDTLKRLRHNLQNPDGGFAPITNVVEYEGQLFLGNLKQPAWALLPLGE